MPNRNYIKGVRKERAIVNAFRSKGCVAFRSAGSHSPIDVCIIDANNKSIRLIQCKPDNMSIKSKSKLQSSLSYLNGVYLVQVLVE